MSASAGKVLLMPKGDYNSATAYAVLDWVRYQGASYVCKQASQGNLPTNTTYWSMLVQDGEDLNAYHINDTAETTLDDADYLPFYDTSATAKRKTLWSNIKSVLKTYFDTLYATVSSLASKAEISSIGTNETGTTASKAYAVGEHFYKNGKFCTAKAAIAQGAQFTLGTNYVEGTVAEHLMKPIKILEITRTTGTSHMYEEIEENVDVSTYDSLIIHVKLGSSDTSLNIMEIINEYYKTQNYQGDSYNFYGIILIQNKKITKAYICSRWDSTQNYRMRVYGIKY